MPGCARSRQSDYRLSPKILRPSDEEFIDLLEQGVFEKEQQPATIHSDNAGGGTIGWQVFSLAIMCGAWGGLSAELGRSAALPGQSL